MEKRYQPEWGAIELDGVNPPPSFSSQLGLNRSSAATTPIRPPLLRDRLRSASERRGEQLSVLTPSYVTIATILGKCRFCQVSASADGDYNHDLANSTVQTKRIKDTKQLRLYTSSTGVDLSSSLSIERFQHHAKPADDLRGFAHENSLGSSSDSTYSPSTSQVDSKFRV